MSSSLPAKIDLFGDHPLAILLAKSLARRGWLIDSDALDFADYPWLGMAYGLIQPLGYDLPVWPLKWSFQHLDLFYRPQAKTPLSSWTADLLDLSAMKQESLPVSQVADQAGLAIHLNFCNCQGILGLPVRNGVLELTQPVGVLECYESEQDALCVSALDAKHLAYSYFWKDQDLFLDRLRALYPEQSFKPLDLLFQSACECWPQVISDHKQVVLQLPRPSLSPKNMILQGLGWSLLASLIRWLSLDCLNAEQVSQRLLDSLNKFNQAQQDRLQKHNFFAIPG